MTELDSATNKEIENLVIFLSNTIQYFGQFLPNYEQ